MYIYIYIYIYKIGLDINMKLDSKFVLLQFCVGILEPCSNLIINWMVIETNGVIFFQF